MGLFEEESFDRAVSSEQYDCTLTIVGIRSWLILSICIGLAALTILWACFSTIPITVSGKCLVFAPEHILTLRTNSSGVVKQIRALGGDKVEKGETLLILENSGGAVEYKVPASGSLIWVELSANESVEPNQIIAYMETETAPADLKILGFFSLLYAQSIEPGMEVKCLINSVDSAKYGMLRGRVKQILHYPVNPHEYYLQKIPSESLKKYLINDPLPTNLVVIEPILDPNTPSGLSWTSAEGPPAPIQPATIGIARVILDQVRPISYVIPSLRK